MEVLHRRTHLTRVELVQTLVDPLLHVQPLLQLLPVVLHGHAGVPLRDMTPVIRRKVPICCVQVLLILQGRARPVCCHIWTGAASRLRLRQSDQFDVFYCAGTQEEERGGRGAATGAHTEESLPTNTHIPPAWDS